jgi:GT2 family glycosyltransferase
VPVRLSIQIVTWNSATVIGACLDSLVGQSCPDFEVVVVDNASADGSFELAASFFDGRLAGRAIREPVNLGFCGGHNRALAISSGGWVLLLNPDAELPADFVALALEVVDRVDPDVGTIGPKIALPDGRIDSTGLVVDRFRRVFDRGRGEPDDGRWDTEEDVAGCTGAVVLHRREMLEDIAVDGAALDDALFAYYDDLDLAWRARASGWRCRYLPRLRAIHRRSGRSALRARAADPPRAAEQALMVRNRILVMAKCEPAGALLRGLPWLVPFELARTGFLLLRAPGALAGYPRALAALPRALRDRKIIRAAAMRRPGHRSSAG